jgi:hypothetical protein
MPAPAPPPRLTLRSADVQAGVPDAALLALAEAAEDAAPVAAAPVPAAVALEAADGELGAAVDDVDDVDDAAHPAASTPAARSGTASSAFFTRLPSVRGTNEVSQ